MRFLISVAYALLAGVAGTVALEIAHLGGFRAAFGWVIKRAGDFTLNAGLFGSLVLLITAVFGNGFAAAVTVMALMFLLCAASVFKRAARNEPLFFADLLLAFKVMGVAGASNIIITTGLFKGFIACVIAFIGLFFIRPETGSWQNRLFFILLSAISLAVLSGQRKDDYNYNEKGFLSGLFLNAVLYFTPLRQPEQPETPIVGIINRNTEHTDIKPNVIAVLSESFFDITRVGGLQLSRDPLPFYRTLGPRSVTGTLLVTPLGGGTCAVEAEFLTGTVGRHFNWTKPFYYSVAKRPIPSLATHFKGLGYEARAVHTFSKTFYNRDKALKNMGFDSFLGLEDLHEPQKDGYYVSDAVLTDMIVREYNKKKGPAFIFGVSMENHQPYNSGKYNETAVSVLNRGISTRAKAEAECYIHCLTHVDREIKKLVEFVDSRPEPTVLLFFGDHLGALGPDLMFYREMGYAAGDNSAGDVLNLYTPDFFILSNYKTTAGRYNNIGANFLSNILLDYIGGDKPELYHVMDIVFRNLRCVSRPDVFINGDANPINELTPELTTYDRMLRAAGYKAVGVIKEQRGGRLG